jgi:hypothetical protein
MATEVFLEAIVIRGAAALTAGMLALGIGLLTARAIRE